MSPKRTLSTSGRVLRQLRHDHRTTALIFFMPSILLIVLRYVFDGQQLAFNSIAPLLLGIIPFILMFIVTSVAVLRERTSGTLERLLTSPATKFDILLGYAVAFALLAFIQAGIASAVMLHWLGVEITGNTWLLLGIAVLSGVLGMSLGLLSSAFARNEFQAVQFMPAFILPQLLTCGLFVPREQMAPLLQYFADVMPVTYVVQAMEQVRMYSEWTKDLTIALIWIGGYIVVALLLGAASLRSK